MTHRRRGVGLGARREQRLDALAVAAERGEEERSPPAGRAGLAVGTRGEEAADALGVPAVGGEVLRENGREGVRF